MTEVQQRPPVVLQEPLVGDLLVSVLSSCAGSAARGGVRCVAVGLWVLVL